VRVVDHCYLTVDALRRPMRLREDGTGFGGEA